MPYEWIIAPDHGPAAPIGNRAQSFAPALPTAAQVNAPTDAQTDAPATNTETPLLAEVHLWPYRSLPRKGFAGFIAATALLLAVPLLSLIGLAVLWVLLPFLILAVAAIWYALQRSYRDGEILEVLRLSPQRISLTRTSRRHPKQVWDANPYWVRLRSHDAPVADYLTFEGGPREVELGAFLAPEERRRLSAEITALLREARAPKPS